MSNLQESAMALARLDRLQELGYRWDAAARELAGNGFGEQAIADGLRVKGAWKAMASSLKSEGQPYEDIVVRLQQMYAGWADIASSLLAAGVALIRSNCRRVRHSSPLKGSTRPYSMSAAMPRVIQIG